VGKEKFYNLSELFRGIKKLEAYFVLLFLHLPSRMVAKIAFGRIDEAEKLISHEQKY